MHTYGEEVAKRNEDTDADRAYKAMFERAEKQAQTYQARIDTQRAAITAFQGKVRELEADIAIRHTAFQERVHELEAHIALHHADLEGECDFVPKSELEENK